MNSFAHIKGNLVKRRVGHPALLRNSLSPSLFCRYGNQLKKARSVGIKKSLLSSAAVGALYFIMFNTFALGFW